MAIFCCVLLTGAVVVTLANYSRVFAKPCKPTFQKGFILSKQCMSNAISRQTLNQTEIENTERASYISALPEVAGGADHQSWQAESSR